MNALNCGGVGQSQVVRPIVGDGIDLAVLETVYRTVAGVSQLHQVVTAAGALDTEVPVHGVGRLTSGIDPGRAASRIVGAGEGNGPIGADDGELQQRCRRPLAELELRPEVSARGVDAAGDGTVLFARRGGQAFIYGGDTRSRRESRNCCAKTRPGPTRGWKLFQSFLYSVLGVSDHAFSAGHEVICGVRIEAGYLAVLVVLGALHLIADAEVQGQVRQDFPVVLEVQPSGSSCAAGC